MKYNEFKMSDLLDFTIYDSEFMNRKMLEKQQKSYIYFEKYMAFKFTYLINFKK